MGKPKQQQRTNGVAASDAVGREVLAQLDAGDTAYLRRLMADVEKAQHALQSFGNYQQQRHGVPDGAELTTDGAFLAPSEGG